MLEFIQGLDVKILVFVNQGLQSSFLDSVFPYFTNLHKIFWVKLFFFPSLMAFWIYKEKWDVPRILLALIIAAALSDTLGYRVLKSSIKRDRPNNTPYVEQQLRLLRNPQSYSFPSNHSMNSFTVATVAVVYYPYLAWLLYPLVSLVAIFRVYAGVHYPSDILGGALLGLALGWALQRFIFQKVKFFKK